MLLTNVPNYRKETALKYTNQYKHHLSCNIIMVCEVILNRRHIKYVHTYLIRVVVCIIVNVMCTCNESRQT